MIIRCVVECDWEVTKRSETSINVKCKKCGRTDMFGQYPKGRHKKKQVEEQRPAFDEFPL